MKSMRLDYTDPTQITELYDFDNNIKYKYCSACEAGYMKNSFPYLYTKSGDKKTVSGSITTYTRSGDAVEYLKYSGSTLTEFKYEGGVYKITNYQTTTNTNLFKYTSFSSTCPQPVCKRVIDIIFVLDASGSIAEQEWEQMINFCKNIVNSYEIASDAAQVGIVSFASFGVKHLDLSPSKTKVIQTFNNLVNGQLRGGTCTGCGIMIAKSMFDGTSGTSRQKNYNPEHLMFTITDGGVSHPDYYSCTKAYTGSFYNFCVGCCAYSSTRPYCSTYNNSCTTNNIAFTLSGSTACSKRSECKSSTYNSGVYKCSGCYCDSSCKYLVCSSCKLTTAYVKCRNQKNVMGCKTQSVPSNYYYTNYTNSITQIKKDARLTSIAIGVGSYSASQLQLLATSISGYQTVFGLTNYEQLNDILNTLIVQSCTKLDDIQECGPECAGFCGCNKKCYCPTCETFGGAQCLQVSCSTDKSGLSSTGCVVKDVVCTNDKCNIPTRSNTTTGCCSYKKLTCDDKKFCTEDSCVVGTGCVYKRNESKCEDFDGCTEDKCDDITGCSNTRYSYCSPPDKCHVVDVPCQSLSSTSCAKATFKEKCTCDDPCMVPVCNESDGNCSCVPMDCSTGDLCYEGYCQDGVCLKKRNTTKIKECQNLNDNCNYYYCENSECKQNKIDCGACESTDLNCSKFNNQCYEYRCVDIAGVATCNLSWQYEPNPDKCLRESCDNNSGIVSDPMEPSYVENCVLKTCVDGTYVDTPLCNDTKCIAYTCGENDTCVPHSKCADYEQFEGKDNHCRVFDRCDEKTGECIYRDAKTCESGPCKESYCDKEKGECVIIDNSTNCQSNDSCVIPSCDPEKGCVYHDKDCDDGDPCTIDSCEDGECIHEPKCVQIDLCQEVICSPSGVCLYEDKVCPEANDTCHYSTCEDGNCTLKIITTAFMDPCGECVSTYGDLLEKGNTTVCIGSLSKGEFAAVIGGAAVAGIVVAAIIVAAVVGISSTIGVRELVKRSKMADDSGVNDNPLYEAEDNEGNNPMFEAGSD